MDASSLRVVSAPEYFAADSDSRPASDTTKIHGIPTLVTLWTAEQYESLPPGRRPETAMYIGDRWVDFALSTEAAYRAAGR